MSAVGIVAIGRNEGARLEQCLESLLKLTARIVYADSASGDGSAALARSMGVDVVELSDDSPLSAAVGRSTGFERLRMNYPDLDIVQFIDGDCLLDPDWLATASQFLDLHPRAAAVCGRRREAHPKASLYNAMADAEWDTPVGLAGACGGDALFRVKPYEAVGGFRADLLAGEEPELCGRLREKGWEIWRIDANMTEHDARMAHFGQWWRRSRRGGYGYAQVWDVTRRSGDPLYGRQLASAAVWVAGLPLLMVAIAILTGRPSILLAIPMAYAVQILRITMKIRDDRARKMARAALIFLGKIPEFSGAIRYLLRSDRPTAARQS